MKFINVLYIIFSLNIYFNSNARVSLSKRLLYEISLGYNVLKDKLINKTCKNYWWNVIDNNIILSALPLDYHKNEFLNFAQKTNKKLAILSLVESYELEPGWLNIPVSPNEWALSGTRQLILEIADLHPPTLEQIKKAIEYLIYNEKNNYLTVVHCKAGQGRSATIVICKKITEDAQFNNLNLENICDQNIKKIITDYTKLIRKQRASILLNRSQNNIIFEFIKYLKTNSGKEWLISLS